MEMIRYQIQLNRHRATVALDEIIDELLAIKLNTKPGTKEAHLAVIKQLKIFLPDDPGSRRADHASPRTCRGRRRTPPSLRLIQNADASGSKGNF